MIPKGYTVDDEGVKRNGRLLSRTPFTIDSCLRDEHGRVHLVFCFQGKTILASRSDVIAGRLDALADAGLDLGRHNARPILRYVMSFPAQESPTHEQMGWVGGGFMAGDMKVTPDSYECVGHLPIPSDLIKGYRQGGTWEGWLEMAKRCAKYPRVMLGLYASGSAPILSILQAPSLALRYSGPASTGKSTAVRLAASVWGNQDLIHPWSAPERWLEDAAARNRDLPLFLDEPRRRLDLERRYDVILSGRSLDRIERGRAIPGYAWRTCCIGTGHAAMDEWEDEGLLCRVVDLWGSPFGKEDEATLSDVLELQAASQQHHGHMGPRLAQRLLKVQDLWPKWRALHEELKAFNAKRGGSGLSSRCAETLTCLQMSANIIHTLMPELDWKPQAPIQELWDWVKVAGSQIPEAKAGLSILEDWATENKGRIFGLHEPRGWSQADLVPPGGWIGRTDTDGALWLMKGRVAEVLAEKGLLPEKVFREWWAAGELLPGAQGGYATRKRIGDDMPVCLGFRPRVWG